MSFRRNTSTNHLRAFALVAAFTLVLVGGVGRGRATSMPTPEPAVLERNPVDVARHPVFPVSASVTWEEVRIPTRQDVRQRLLLAKGTNQGTKAVILFTGGNGTPISVKRAGGSRLTGNFLVRSSPLFASEGFITAIVDAPSDKPEGAAGGRDGGMDDAFRQSSMHLTDIRAVVDFLVSEGVRDVFLIGTSRGTLSVAYLATRITHANVRGYVLTASLDQISSYAGRITRPVLMAHHADDGCFVTTYAGAQATYDALANSPRKDFITVTGGAAPKDDNPCRARTAHGFLGKERETVAALVAWMAMSAPKRR